jgi:hypothetical protein
MCRLPIDADAARSDPFLQFTARAEAGIGQRFLQFDGLFRCG